MLAQVLWTLQPGRGGDDAKCLLLALLLVKGLVIKVLGSESATEEQAALLLKHLKERADQDLQASEQNLEGEGAAMQDRAEAQRG